MLSPSDATIWLDRLIQQHQWSLFGFVRGMLRDEEAARDVAQETFCDAWRALQQGREPFRVPFDAQGARRWLFHVAYRRAISWARRGHRIRYEPLDTLDHQDLVVTPFDERIAEGDALHQALRALPAHEVAILMLNVVQGFPISEAASITEVSLHAAKKRLSRAKQHLRAAYFANETLLEDRLP